MMLIIKQNWQHLDRISSSTKANAEAKAAYEKAVEENTAKNTAIQAENEAIRQRNATAKSTYDAAVKK